MKYILLSLFFHLFLLYFPFFRGIPPFVSLKNSPLILKIKKQHLHISHQKSQVVKKGQATKHPWMGPKDVNTQPEISGIIKFKEGYAPHYPEAAISNDMEGDVHIKLWYDPLQKKIIRHKILKSSGYRLLDQEVIRFIYLPRNLATQQTHPPLGKSSLLVSQLQFQFELMP